MVPGASLEEKFEWLTGAGWDAIELRGKGAHAFRARLPELKRARGNGVVMPSVCVEMDHFIGAFDPELRADAVSNMVDQIDVIAEVGGQVAVTPASWGMFSLRLPPFVPPRSAAEDRVVLLDSLRILGERAQAAGVVICLEPLNRYEDHMVNRIDQAVSLITELEVDSVKVCVDFFHMNIEETDISVSLRAGFANVGHVQVSDSNRFEPGAGHLDWQPALATLSDLGYDGYFSLESRLTAGPETAIPAAGRFLRHVASR
jgi:sugar phosphate isomerase/epimerase